MTVSPTASWLPLTANQVIDPHEVGRRVGCDRPPRWDAAGALAKVAAAAQ